jgi:iron(III) transport system ATP-binding protein
MRVESLADEMRRCHVRYMPQDRDNFLELRVEDAMLAASQGHDPNGEMFQQFLSSIGKRKRVGMLSSGSRALLSLAQTLASGPRLALLDEPFANVDRANRQRIRELISHARREFGTAFLVAEHEGVDLPEADRYTIRRNGNGGELKREK